MAGTQTMERLCGVFRTVFDDDAIVLRAEMTAADVDGWDSLSHVNLVLAVENAFKIRLSTKDIMRCRNVGEFADVIERKSAGSP
ncbi:MAG: acyl carrier protein [Elusimicrobia bacterium]|nr:acyl carrier protein [Elusimicrobiota bacterium]